jgi:hypothetical protein
MRKSDTPILIRPDADSVEHNDVEVVAVNDPFIEPKYAVRT